MYDKKLTFILYNNRSDNEKYKCTKKTVVFDILGKLISTVNRIVISTIV